MADDHEGTMSATADARAEAARLRGLRSALTTSDASGLDDDRARATPQPSPWTIVPASADWITESLPPREHLLVDERTGRGAVDRTGVWLFAGAGGAGKSYATIGLAMAVARGGAWLSTFRAARGRALLLAAEDGTDDIRRRAHAIASAEDDYPLDAIERMHVLSLGDRVTSLVAQRGDVYAASADTESLCAELAARDPYDLVVVDPYGRIAGVSVDADNAAAAATIGALAMLAAAARGLVLGVTHTSGRARLAARNGAPEGATGVRGATGQVDYARGVLRLERDEASDLLTLSLAKANHVAPWAPVMLRRGERGELIALDADELATVEAERAPRTAADREADKEHKRRERDRLDDVAARQALGEHPGLPVRDLTAIVRKARACGGDRAHAAITRVRLAAAGGPDE